MHSSRRSFGTFCPIRNFLRVRGSADLRTLTDLWTGSGQEIHENLRTADEIQGDLRVPDGRWFHARKYTAFPVVRRLCLTITFGLVAE